PAKGVWLAAEPGDPAGQPGDIAARGVAVDLPLARRAHERGLRRLHGLGRLVTIAGRDRLLDLPHGVAHPRPARLVDLGAAGDLARGFAGGAGVGHGPGSKPLTLWDVAKIQRRRGLSAPARCL